MNLNQLEDQFFDQVLGTELDIPVRATLTVDSTSLELIIVPTITPAGYFELKYFNAPAYDPPTERDEGGTYYQRWEFDECLGLHPLLKRAWMRRDPVTLQLHMSRPKAQQRNLQLDARVISAGIRGQGRLALHQNQVAVRDSQLTRAKFCIAGFPDFVTPDRDGEWIKKRREVQAEQHSSSDTGESQPETIPRVTYPPRYVVLRFNGSWEITLTRDQEQTRDTISHTGVIGKRNNGEFSTSELGDVLEVLNYFFAFTAGAYRHPTVVIGFDPDRQIVWGQVGKFDIDSLYTPNWFNHDTDVLTGKYLEALFSIFWTKWHTKGDEIAAVIQSYVHSVAMRRAGVPEDAVAKSFAGLEVLASLIKGSTIAGDAGEAIDQVLHNSSIANQELCKSATPALVRLCDELGIASMRGTHLLAAVRHYVTHPLDRKKPAEIKGSFKEFLDSDPMTYVYLHDLSQFYLEYLLLDYCGLLPRTPRRLLEQINS